MNSPASRASSISSSTRDWGDGDCGGVLCGEAGPPDRRDTTKEESADCLPEPAAPSRQSPPVTAEANTLDAVATDERGPDHRFHQSAIPLLLAV